MSPPELPGQESLQRWIRLVHQRSSAIFTKVEGLLEVLGLLPIEYIALAVVGGSAARLLVAEGGTALDGQGLVRVDKRLADGEGDAGGSLKVDGDKGARHGRVARQEERPALLDDPCEPVADRVHPQVRSVVANSNHDRRLPAFGCKKEVVRVCGKIV